MKPVAVNKLNLNTKDMDLLKYIYSDNNFEDKIMKIRKLFNYYKRVDILIFEDVSEMSNYLGLKIPSWVVGASIENTILLIKYEKWKDTKPDTFSQLLIHEFVHLATGFKTKYTCPIWLNEGLALYFSEQYRILKVKDKVMINKNNIYEFGYQDEILYLLCGKVVEKLIFKYELENVIPKISEITDFENDNLLGIDNMKLILGSLEADGFLLNTN